MTQTKTRPNVLVLCVDQWDAHMELPQDVELPAMSRLVDAGVTLDRHYCTVPICTPSRASVWTGMHAKGHQGRHVPQRRPGIRPPCEANGGSPPRNANATAPH